ncbi:hypothetical protein [Suipraeoptans intestinalis]|nr:hypothetical protein [Suipraeoptans intestinalis]MDY3122695.1 hypothetical protein [Suipraeoptans intestinalis]
MFLQKIIYYEFILSRETCVYLFVSRSCRMIHRSGTSLFPLHDLNEEV